jgi:hypothetical protein
MIVEDVEYNLALIIFFLLVKSELECFFVLIWLGKL